ncbi:MAG: DeoR family transcriptional regulator [Oligoflexales bacterium]
MRNQLEALFYKGDYKTLVETVEKTTRITPSELIFVIAANVFLGRIHEAQALYEEDGPNPEAKCANLFFLALHFVRSSQYSKARQMLARALILARKNPKLPQVQFFAYQGIAFLKFFYGKLARCQSFAEIAYDAAIKGNFQYGKILSLDLLGHSYVNSGMVVQGLKFLEEALSISIAIGHQANAEAVRVSIQKYKCQMGIDGDNALRVLTELEETISDKDTYTRSELLLELARQYTLRGRFEDADRVIGQGFDIVYRHGNLRQVSKLNFHIAYLLYLRGEYVQALSLLKTSRMQLDSTADIPLKCQIIGLELQILRADGKISSETTARLQDELVVLSSNNQQDINRRVLSRQGLLSEGSPPVGNDRIGDLIDLKYSDLPRAVSKIIESGYFSLLADRIPFFPKNEGIVFDFEPGVVLLAGRKSISIKHIGNQTVGKRICSALSNSSTVDKATLVRKVWGYQYHPLRHDSLIYTAIARLRALFAPNENWLIASESGYKLGENIQVHFEQLVSLPNVEVKTQGENSSQKLSLRDNLNYRQFRLINELRENQALSVSEFAKSCDISIMTAFRDLTGLVDRGILKHNGRGRSRRYYLASNLLR